MEQLTFSKWSCSNLPKKIKIKLILICYHSRQILKKDKSSHPSSDGFWISSNFIKQIHTKASLQMQRNALGLKMYDIAMFVYRNHHPCIDQYLCAWHNEVNYYSYYGQLFVYYPVVRLQSTSYLYFPFTMVINQFANNFFLFWLNWYESIL